MKAVEESIAKFNQIVVDEEIEISKHKSEYEITNTFGRDSDLSCCCWMPIHYDEYYLDKTGCYTVNVVYCSDNATLLHRNGGKIVATELKVGEQIVFKAKNQHCLVPADIAEQCTKHQSFQAAKRFFAKIEKSNAVVIPTVAVWEFVE